MKDNKLLAEYLKWKIYDPLPKLNRKPPFLAVDTPFGKYDISDLKFHKSWDWLMKVVEKIGKKDGGYFRLNIEENINGKSFDCWLTFDGNTGTGKTKIKAVYNACVEYIKQKK